MIVDYDTQFMTLSRRIFILFAGLLCNPLAADFRSYEADLEESEWFYFGNPVICQMRHNIPLYGFALFNARASRTPNMTFVLDSMRNRLKTDSLIDVRAIPASWQPGKESKSLGVVTAVPGEKTLNIHNEAAWKLLITLESGKTPSFFYRDFIDESDRVSVSLSAVNFQNVYEDFLQCVEKLLPYDFNEIKYTMINFDFNKSELSATDREKLDVLAEFLKHDPEVEAVLVEGHTDSIARRRYNKALGHRRAKRVKSYLMDQGVSADSIRTTSRGERRPLESNATPEGRALNRRVFITMSKS